MPEQCVLKHEVIKRVLVRWLLELQVIDRWNYCMKWPDDSTTPQNILEEREKLRVRIASHSVTCRMTLLKWKCLDILVSSSVYMERDWEK